MQLLGYGGVPPPALLHAQGQCKLIVHTYDIVSTPHLSPEAVLVTLAKRYAILPPNTRRKLIRATCLHVSLSLGLLLCMHAFIFNSIAYVLRLGLRRKLLLCGAWPSTLCCWLVGLRVQSVLPGYSMIYRICVHVCVYIYIHSIHTYTEAYNMVHTHRQHT